MPRNAGDRRVALVTLGCARNEVDSEELAGRLAGDGWELVDASDADVVLVNTCGFVEQAKKDSVDTLLAASDGGAKVVAAGCMAERYGNELATALPEADAVLGFDDYASISDRLDRVLAGEELTAHTPRDRRTLLPISPVERSAADVAVPGHAELPAGLAPASGPRVLRRRLEGGPVAPLKLASGCDRRCAFCAIPSFRGAFVSRRPTEIVEEARWLASQGVRELVLVSENSSSYGKDLGDPRLLEALLPELAAVPGIVRVRVSYLQPAETRPSLIEVIATTPGVVPYFDLSFQHSSEPVLRRMRRFGSTERFLELLATARRLAPEAGVRSNFIVGFPGETKADVAELARFLTAARLDAIGVFGYSDEDGTEAATLTGKVRRDTIDRRFDRISRLAEELTAQRAEERHGTIVEVLVESVGDDGVAEGRGEHQAPEVDGSVTLHGECPVLGRPAVGDLVRARVTGSLGVDLEAEVLGVVDRVGVEPELLARALAPVGSGG
ncbi:30S ribosomal protein S12 methylthiotransferase RimO [Cryptosporangium arvum]|uniref:30S ribosomal protein S12 methylthiotransferase RimO n=1 Tax=Cryptosporangium arvum TaxID=80871 RepID=UPI0004BA76EA|nr:30S ribosomal protein S12 methylthiotransferase RimO [Cryptosporangium arvum]